MVELQQLLENAQTLCLSPKTGECAIQSLTDCLYAPHKNPSYRSAFEYRYYNLTLLQEPPATDLN